ncbi:MAG: trypco2 family protein [Thermoanaerobaculia bacterium]
MRSNRAPTVLLAGLLLAGSPTACSSMDSKPTPVVSSDGVEVQKILEEVQQALEASAPELKKSHLPPLDSVTLTLQASAVREVDGKINLWILSFGHSVQKEAVQELILTLTPPDPEKKMLGPTKPTLAAQLVEAILGAARGVENADSGNLPLKLQSLEASVAFVVVKDTSAGGSFAIQPVTLSLGGDFKDKAVQKLRLVFKEKKKP